jgi:hypothetical protein
MIMKYIKQIKIAVSILVGIASGIMTYVAMDAPMITATAPAILAVGAAAAAYIAWPKQANKDKPCPICEREANWRGL